MPLSLFAYGQSRELTGHLPVTPEELEYLAGQQHITIIPYFSVHDYSQYKWLCIGGSYGPFQPNVPVVVPIWLAVALFSRKLCRLLPPPWLAKQQLEEVLEEEQALPNFFQPLPFYYVEIAKILFEHVEAFGDDFGDVRSLMDCIRRVRYKKIENGLRKVGAAMTVKLNHLSAAETNMIRSLFKGTLDVFGQISKNDHLYRQANMPPASQPTPSERALTP